MLHRSGMTSSRAPLVARLVLAVAAGLGACPSDGPECTTDDDCGGDKPYCGLLRACVECFVADHCDDGDPCNGQEQCRSTACVAGTPIDCACADPDVDGDGSDSMACGGLDCDDADPGRAPGSPEICDLGDKDEDCDPATYGTRDGDSDGHVDNRCCNQPGTAEEACGDDCDDARPGVHPGLSESCDGIDNDCDGAADETVIATAYVDGDGDGWGTGDATSVCAGTRGYAMEPGDCDDADPQHYPGTFRCAGGPEIDLCEGSAWQADACPGGGECVPQPDGTGVCLPGEGTQCSDGSDNDLDGLIDWQDPNCASPDDDSELGERCSNGRDDDGDLAIDYPADPGCDSTEDTTETDPATPHACSNGIDDDSDGTVDWSLGAGDPGCAAASDDSERDPAGPQCDNGIDDDVTPGIDCCAKFPTGDADCTSPLDDNEGPPACANLLDDDGDMTTDFGDDPGCADAMDDSERGAASACDNGIDDDGDGAADFPGDSGCADAADSSE